MPPIPREQVSPYDPSSGRSSEGQTAIFAKQNVLAAPVRGPPQIAYSIAAAVEATGRAVSRSRMFELIKSGEIDARKIGRRTVIIADSLDAYIRRQPGAAA